MAQLESMKSRFNFKAGFMETFAYTIRGREVPFESEREWESLSRVMESTNKYKGENILWSYILFFKWSLRMEIANLICSSLNNPLWMEIANLMKTFRAEVFTKIYNNFRKCFQYL